MCVLVLRNKRKIFHCCSLPSLATEGQYKHRQRQRCHKVTAKKVITLFAVI